MKRQALTVLAGVAAVLAGTVVPAGSATAAGLPVGTPCTEQRDVEGPQYQVRLCDATDADQYRTGLIKDGTYYCGPSSLFNAMYYLGEHVGLPMRMAANAPLLTSFDPHQTGEHGKATEWIGWLGTQAGMGPDSEGSSSYGNRKAFDTATAGAKAAGWGVARGESLTDGENGIAEYGREIASRLRYAPIQLWFGHYSTNDDATVTRHGGHGVTVVGAKGDVGSGKVELIVHDPAKASDHLTSGYKDSQSTVREEAVTLQRETIIVKHTDKETNVVTTKQRTYWRLTGPTYSGLKYAEALNWFAAAPPVG